MMGVEQKPRRLFVKAETRKSAETQKRSVELTVRTSGLLSYYAQTRRLTESMVVEQALQQLFRGMRISDPGGSAGEDEAVA